MNYKRIASRRTTIFPEFKKAENNFLFLGRERSRFNDNLHPCSKLVPIFFGKIATPSAQKLSNTGATSISEANIFSTSATSTENENASFSNLAPNNTTIANRELVVDNSAKQDPKRPIFPFTAIVGQEEMKLALLLNVIDPKIGGVMIMGDRGTGKSTTVRALVDLLPNIEVVDNDPFNSHPSDAELMSQNVREQVLQGKSLKVLCKKTAMIDLPLGATEDRVCGTIDIEKALSEGIKAFEPGLLAKANRGILYVDEVNLLDDHLVDILLDSAASGWNTVEREGISISHPARFILVGSGNPEEGELRPQLLDRFGMHAQIGTVREAELRVKIVE